MALSSFHLYLSIFTIVLQTLSRGNPEAAFSYFYDDRIPAPAHLRRQRQFVSEPVVLPTTRFAPQTRQEEVKALPSRTPQPQARPGYFFSPVSPAAQQPFVFPPPPPPPPQSHSSSLFQARVPAPQQSFQQLQLFEQQEQQQQPPQPQLLVPEQPQTAEPPAPAPVTEQQKQQPPSLSPFRLQDAVTTTKSTLLFPTTSFARGTHLKPVPAVPSNPHLAAGQLTTDPEEQRSAPPTTEASFAQIRFGAPGGGGPTARPASAANEPFSRPVVNVRSRQTTLSAARPVTAPPTVAAATVQSDTEKTVKRVRKPVRKVRKLKPAVHIVPVSTAAPLPSSSETAAVTAPTSAPAAASRLLPSAAATGFRHALRSRSKGVTGLRGRVHHHGSSDNKLR